MSAADWAVRQGEYKADESWVLSSLREELARNSYFHGVPKHDIEEFAGRVMLLPYTKEGWQSATVTTADEEHEPAGWVIYRHVPALTIAYAFVEESFRGLGAWRALRDHIGLKPGQLVNVILASPQAMSAARKLYMAKHNWGQVLTWL